MFGWFGRRFIYYDTTEEEAKRLKCFKEELYPL